MRKIVFEERPVDTREGNQVEIFTLKEIESHFTETLRQIMSQIKLADTVSVMTSYIDQPTVIRLKNQMLQVTPDDLKGEYDIDVNTEAGIGRRKQTIDNLQYYLTQIAPAGLQLQAITPGEWAKAAQKLLQESGIRNPQDYVLDPEIIKQQFFMALQQAMIMQQQQQIQGAAQVGQEAGKAAGQEALKARQAQQKAQQQQAQAAPNPTQQAAQALRYATVGGVL